VFAAAHALTRGLRGVQGSPSARYFSEIWVAFVIGVTVLPDGHGKKSLSRKKDRKSISQKPQLAGPL
jgi:hypothetical protein